MHERSLGAGWPGAQGHMTRHEFAGTSDDGGPCCMPTSKIAERVLDFLNEINNTATIFSQAIVTCRIAIIFTFLAAKRLARPTHTASPRGPVPALRAAPTVAPQNCFPTYDPMLKKMFAAVLMTLSTAAIAVPFGSQSILVVEDGTGKVLLEKNSNVVVPIASLTKLMTAMVVLDSKANMQEEISIDREDVDTLKHSTSRVPVGATLSRHDVLQLALMSSDNRAAASLARTYPGGPTAFAVAVNAKIKALGMRQTVIEEPTGLSPNNQSTAADLVKMAVAASRYPEISRITTDSKDVIQIKGRDVEYHNTNRLVGAKGWDIGLSKTGYTNEAGRCLIMRIKSAGKFATMILLNARANSVRAMDAVNIRRMLAAENGIEEPKVMRASVSRHKKAPAKPSKRRRAR
eukprot:gene19081-22848_t